MTGNIVFCLLGPTASGKTDLACELVQRFPFEIISVDSAMIYRDMDIGTAKPDPALLKRAPHHLIDCLNPDEIYSAAQFCSDTMALCHRIHQNNKIPLLVGGTMMYFQALQQGLATLPEANPTLRAQLILEAEQKGWEHMHRQLQQVDPVSAAKIHSNDTQRIQRALEVYYISGQSLSSMLLAKNETKASSSLTFFNFCLIPEQRSWLHQRIEKRFENMLMQGLIEEVQALLTTWSLTSSHPSIRSVGYRQVYDYLNGACDRDQLLEKGVIATRQLAKRQLTWLRHWPNGSVIDPGYELWHEEIVAKMREILDNLN